MMKVEQLYAKYQAALPEKERFKLLYDDVYRYGMPDRYAELKEYKDAAGTKHRVNIVDSTLEIACDDFVNRVQSLIAPVNTDWIDIEAGFMFENAQGAGLDEANRRLGTLARLLNIYKATSNFDMTMTEGIYDLIPGQMTLLCIEGDDRHPLLFAAVPFREITYSLGPDGSVWYYFRKIVKKNWEVKQQWHDAKFEFDAGSEDKEAPLLEATFYDPKTRRWNYWVISERDKSKIVEREYRTSPFIDLGWTRTSGETYSRGQGLKVIADFKTLNKIKEYALRALAFIVPFFTAVSDEDYKNWQIEPGAIIPVNSNMNDNPSIRGVEVKQQADLQQWNIQQLTMAIKRGMFSTTLSDIPDQTATAVSLEHTQQNRIISNSLGRLNVFLENLVKRMIDVLQRQGLFPLDFDLEMLNGYGAKLRVRTELGNLAAAEKIQKKLQGAAAISQLDPTGQALARYIKMDKAVPAALRALGFDAEDIRTESELAEYDQRAAELAAAQQQQNINTEIAISNAKEDGKAAAKARYANGQ